MSDADVNLAIRVMLESFINAQKFAVTKTLRGRLSRFLEGGADLNQLLLARLREIVKHKQATAYVRAVAGGAGYADDGGDVEDVTISLPELRERAAKHSIDDATLKAFLTSAALTGEGFQWDPTESVIRRSF